MAEDQRRVLVVDDEQLILKIISDILTKEGYDVLVANNCEKAAELLKTTRFDVVLSDIKMPIKSGIDLLEEITKRLSRPSRAGRSTTLSSRSITES